MPLLLSLLLGASLLVAPMPPLRYKIDPGHSHIGFAVRHLMVSTVRGRFDSLAGTIQYDPEHPDRSSVSVRIVTASLNSGNTKRDADVRSADLLDVAAYPTITFESLAIRRAGEGMVADGKLTIHGVTRSVAIPFVLTGPIRRGAAMSTIGVEGELVIDRRDFGLSFSRTVPGGGLIVGNEVRIELQLEAHAKEGE